mgnify:CR=1 FL=1
MNFANFFLYLSLIFSPFFHGYTLESNLEKKGGINRFIPPRHELHGDVHLCRSKGSKGIGFVDQILESLGHSHFVDGFSGVGHTVETIHPCDHPHLFMGDWCDCGQIDVIGKCINLTHQFNGSRDIVSGHLIITDQIRFLLEGPQFAIDGPEHVRTYHFSSRFTLSLLHQLLHCRIHINRFHCSHRR